MTTLVDMIRQTGAQPTDLVVSVNTSGDGNTLVAAVAGKIIVVLSYALVAAGTVSAKFRSYDGVSTYTDLTGAMPLVANQPIPGGISNPFGIIHTISGQALTMNLSSGVAVTGVLKYIQG